MIDKPNPIDLHVGDCVRRGRRMRGMSLAELADRIGLADQQVQEYERGLQRISASRLVSIARALDLPIAFFFRGLVEVVVGPWGVGEDVARQLASHILPAPNRLTVLAAFPIRCSEAMRVPVIDPGQLSAANDDMREMDPPQA